MDFECHARAWDLLPDPDRFALVICDSNLAAISAVAVVLETDSGEADVVVLVLDSDFRRQSWVVDAYHRLSGRWAVKC